MENIKNEVTSKPISIRLKYADRVKIEDLSERTGLSFAWVIRGLLSRSLKTLVTDRELAEITHDLVTHSKLGEKFTEECS